MRYLKLFFAAVFVLGIDILIPFTTNWGLNYVVNNGKLLLFGIALVNIFVGAGISGGFFEKDVSTGFKYWFKRTFTDTGKINPTHGFAVIITVINLLIVLFWIEP